MDNGVLVPIDLTGEEKEVLAILSKRQLILVAPVLLIGIWFLASGDIPFLYGITDFVIRLIVVIIVGAIAALLAFVHLSKYEQYLSEYLVTQYKFRKSQKLYHY